MINWILGLVYLPLVIAVNGIIVISILIAARNSLRRPQESTYGAREQEEVEPVQFVVIDDSVENYEVFLRLTYELDAIRKKAEQKDLKGDERDELMADLDSRIMQMQELLAHIHMEGLPNPDVLTKRYLQELSMRVLVLRVLFERLNGRFFPEVNNDTVKIIKMAPRNTKQEK